MKKLIGYMKGVNLGGWLSQGEYTKEHLDSFIGEEDIKTIASWGLDHVRLPIDYNIFETDEGEPLETGFCYVDSALEWCKKYGLNLVLDLHKCFGYSFYSGDNQEGFFDSEKLQERFYKLWERLATRYAGFSDRMAFELLNEVNDPAYKDSWNAIAAKTISIIRKYSKDIKIFLGSYWNNSVDALHDLELPADENIVYNFHCYDPFLFTHQGAYWVDEMPEDLRVDFPGDIKFYRQKMVETGLDRIQDYLDVPDSGFDREYFDGRFRNAVKLCEDRGVCLYCGEYGVIDRADPQQILHWYKCINPVFEKYGIGRSAWNYKEKDFGLIAEGMKPVIDELVKYL